MFTKKAVPTTEEIKALYESGDVEALRDINETLAKRANQRMVELEKNGFDTTAAYKRASKWIEEESDSSKGNRFSRSKKLDIDDLKDQILAESKFLRWQTSTRIGEIQRRETVFESLASGQSPVLNIPKGETRDSFKNKFLQFLSEDVWTDIKKHLYHKDILNEAGEAIAAGASVSELVEAFNKYQSGESSEDRFSIWNNWISVKDR